MLSAGGCLVLIKHVLAAIPLHSYAILEPPKSVMRQIERLMSHFFWGEVDGHKKGIGGAGAGCFSLLSKRG